MALFVSHTLNHSMLFSGVRTDGVDEVGGRCVLCSGLIIAGHLLVIVTINI